MQVPHPQQQYPMSSAELWDALQRQQAATQYNGHAQPMLHSGSTLAPLHSYELPPQAGAPQAHQPIVLSGKPLPTGGAGTSMAQGQAPYYSQPGVGGSSAGGGIAGVPSSLTSLPGMPYSSTPSPPPPQLYSGSSPSLGLQQAVPTSAAPPQLAGHAGFPQLSGISSQLSSGMMLGGNLPPPHLVPNHQHMAAPSPGSTVMYSQGQQQGGLSMPMHMPVPVPMPLPINMQQQVKMDPEDHPSSSHSVVALPLPIPGSPESDDEGDGDADGDGSPSDCMGSGGLNKSRYRGVSYDRKKAKWRVQIKVAALGKSGVSVGYFDTEEAAARAYDRAAIGLLGRDNPNLQTNFDARDYMGETIPPLTGKTREEVKTTLKSERIKQAPRRRFTSRQRTSRFMGVGSSNRKNQWQARILVHGKVTHLGYYETEEEAARVYDKVSLALHGDNAQTNFAASNYTASEVSQYSGLDRESLQRALGVKPMDKSSRFRGVSKKKGKWEAKVMVNRRWAYRELFDSEEEAARAYDRALWRLKPKEAHSYVNFKDEVPPEISHMLGEGGGGGHVGGSRHHGRSRGGGLASSDEEEEAASEGSDGFSEDEDGSGGAPQPAAWTARTSRSGRRLRGTTAAPLGSHGSTAAVASQSMQHAAPRAASAPNLHSAAAAAAAASQQHMQAQQQVQQQGSQSGFVPLPGGGLQLQFGGASLGAGGLFGTPPAQTAPVQLPAVGGAMPQTLGGQPLLVRVGSETHLIPHQQQQDQQGEEQLRQQHARQQQQGGGVPDTRMVAGLGGSTLGKRMNRIQSEPAFTFKDEPAGDLSDLSLMTDRELFRAFDITGEDGPMAGSPAMGVSVPGGGSGGGMASQLDHLDLDDTSELLDFIKDMPDAGLPPSTGRNGAGMFKSRSMGNLMDLSVSFFDEDDEALAAMEYARPRKISKSMSMTQLAGLDNSNCSPTSAGAGGAANGRPPLPPSSNGSDPSKLGPLGKPIRRTNTFSSSLAVLQEADREGRAADEQLVPGGGMSSQHSSGDDLVQRLLAPSAPSAEDDAMLADLLGAS